MDDVLGMVTPDHRARALTLDFEVSPRLGYPMGPDIDNLCEPVIRVVVGNLGWFAGRRTGIRTLWARKRVGPLPGVHVRILDGWVPAEVGSRPALLDATWSGELPRSARDEAFATCVGRELRALPSPGSMIAVRLAYSGAVNIGDVSTGRIKSTMDCLWPILGGSMGAPDDGRVAILEAWREDPSVLGTVRVTVVSQGETGATAPM
jgi:hypothetical protein